jgi:hypothetical protein
MAISSLTYIMGFSMRFFQPLDNTEKERSRLSSENGNSVLKVIYHFDDGNVFECAF